MAECILLSGSSLNDENRSLLSEFEKEVFIPAFPYPDEREDMNDIISRIEDESNDELCSYIVLSVDRTPSGSAVLGGLVVDCYRSIQSLEIIYIAVNKQKRGNRIGSELLFGGLDRIRNHGVVFDKAFLEVEIPDPKDSNFAEQVNRLAIWSHWGAKRIPISYIQPPLQPGKREVTNLMLMALPDKSTDGNDFNSISYNGLVSFLKAFYKGLGCSTSSPFFKTMLDEINALEYDGDVDLESTIEIPLFGISSCAITRHYYYNNSKDREWEEADSSICKTYNSFECDLMNYSNQIARPFRTHFAFYVDGVTLIMPKYYSYTSEGITHYRISQRTEVKVNVSVSWTYCVHAKKHIANVTVSPSAGQPVSELEAIRLISAFGSRQECYSPSEPLAFIIDGKAITIEMFLKKKLLGEFLGIKNQTGCFELMDTGTSSFDIASFSSLNGNKTPDFEDFAAEFDDDGHINNGEMERVFCGLILGLFDFNRMDESEIDDTVKPILRTSSSFMVLCRGHLLKIEEQDDDDRKSLSKILISAYLMIPSVALAFAGMAVSISEKLITDIEEKRVHNPINIKEAKRILTKEYISDIFHYNSEKKIFEVGEIQRNLAKKRENLLSRIDLIEEQDGQKSNIILETFLGIVAIFQIIGVLSESIEWPVAFIVIIAVFVIAELLRFHNVSNTKN